MTTRRMPFARIAVRSRLLTAAVCLAGTASAASAQWPPQRLQNIKALPQDISVRALVDTMAGFTRALGVRCTYCHVGSEAIPLGQYNFVTDSLSAKVKAREMIRMVNAINRDHLANLTDRRTPAIVVTCATCHRGVTEPRPLQQILMMAYDEGGADSAEKAYRALRDRYLGRASYDFGEVPLADVADAIRSRSKLPDALRLYKLNVEFSPRSVFALHSAANAELAAGDTSSAVAALQRVLEISPNDQRARTILDGVRRKP